MGVPLRNRLSGNKEQVIEDVMLFGRFYAMTKWGIKDYPGFCRWLENETDDPNIGFHPELDLGKGKDLGEQLIEAMANYIAKAEVERQELREKVAHLNALLGERHIKNATIAAPLLTNMRLLTEA